MEQQIVDDGENYEIISLSAVNDGVVSFDERLLSASMLLGQVITHLRNNGPQNAYHLVSGASDEFLSGGTLFIKVDEKEFADAKSYEQMLSDIAASIAPNTRVCVLKYENNKEKIIAAEIAKIKRLIGDLKIKR